MTSQYPSNVTDKILQITLGANTFAYLAIDEQGIVVNQGGDLKSMGLPPWQPGEKITESAFFLSGMLPLNNNYELLPSIHTNDTEVIDIHLFQDGGIVWIILENKTEDLEWQMLARQKANELQMLRRKVERMDSESSLLPEVSLIFQTLNMVALIHKGDGEFALLKPPAAIFSDLYPELLDAKNPLYPQRRFLFLENFLGDAQFLWDSRDNHRRLRSGPWIERKSDGEEVALEAIALNWEDRALLLIEVLDEDYHQQHRTLQLGREGKLTKDILEHEIRVATREIREREEEISLRLVCAADTRDDGETGSHIRRLGLYSEVIARNLGWEQELIDAIRVAAPMHDIGKIGIPDYILKKPGKLTDAEFDIMKTHPEIGARILSNSKSKLIQMAREISLGHHEKWDGSGYPYGLKGTEIDISARIVAIVDVFDALIHKRVYKQEMEVSEAFDLMSGQRGKHFDPQLFDLFVDRREDMERIAYDYVNPIFSGIGVPEI